MFEKLPVEIILKILSYLSPTDYKSIAGVNKELANITLDNLTWKRLFILYFSNFLDLYNQKDKENWRSAFREIVTCSKEIYKNLPIEIWQRLSKAITEKNIPNYYTILNFAAKTGLEDVVDLLLEEDEPVNSQNCLGGTPLLYACNNGHFNIVKSLLLKGASAELSLENNDGKLKQGENAWHAAIRLAETNYNQAKSIIDLILENNTRSLDKRPIFHKYITFAATQVNVKAVLLLLSLCFKNQLPENPSDNMLIYIAIMENISQDILKLLLPEKDSERHDLVNLKNNYGATALFYAVINRCEQIVEKLINYGAKTNVALTKDFHHWTFSSGNQILKTFNKGETPWHTAVKLAETGAHKAKTILTLLATVQPEHINVKNEEGITPLILAAKEGCLEIVALLLELGALVDCQDKIGATALFYATINAHFSIVQLIIQKGANTTTPLNQSNYFYPENMSFCQGQTPWHAAVELAKTDSHKAETILTLLATVQLEHINVKDKKGITPLILAAKEGCLEIVALLLELGALVDCQDKIGATALFYATINAHFSIVQLIIQKGANTTTPLNQNHYFYPEHMHFCQGQTPWHAAMDFAKTDPHKAKTILTLLASAQPEHINVKDEEGITPLILAAKEGYAKIVELLLKKEALVDCQNKAGATALLYAIVNGYKNSVGLLLKYGANLSITLEPTKIFDLFPRKYSKKGNTLWDRSIQIGGYNIYDVKQCFKTLFSEIIINPTPLFYAAANYHIEIVELILNQESDINNQNEISDDFYKFLLKTACKLLQTDCDSDIDKGKRIVQILLDKIKRNDHPFTIEQFLSSLKKQSEHAIIRILPLFPQIKEFIDTIDDDRETALFYAARENKKGLVGLLLKNNADPSILNKRRDSFTHSNKKGKPRNC